MKEINQPIIVVTDIPNEQRLYSIDSNDTEGYRKTVIEDILATLREIAKDVIWIQGIEDLAHSVAVLRDAVVVPCFFGPASPTSKTLVPAICEAANVPYIGGDAYVQAVCNDKYISRLYAREYGMHVSNAILVHDNRDVTSDRFNRLDYPIVVKPNFGGGSNGVDDICLCRTSEEAMSLARRLLKSQRVSVIVESYLPGKEVQIVFAQLPNGDILESQIGISIEGKEFFNNELFGLSSKKRHSIEYAYAPTNCVSNDSLQAMRRVFQSFSKVEFMRIDCRVAEDGTARLIELSPDCSMARSGGLSRAFAQSGYSYTNMFSLLIGNVLTMHQ